MIAILIASLASAAPPSDPEALATAEKRAGVRIEACRVGPCDEDRATLGEAFLLRATAAAALRGQIDEVSAANARLLVPERAAELEDLLPRASGAEPESWVRAWVAERGEGGVVSTESESESEPGPEPEPEPEPEPLERVRSPVIIEDLDGRAREGRVRWAGGRCVVRGAGLSLSSVTVRGAVAYRGHDRARVELLRWARGGRLEVLRGERRVDYANLGPRSFSFKTGPLGRTVRATVRGEGRVRTGSIPPLLGRGFRFSDACSPSQVRLGVVAVHMSQNGGFMEPEERAGRFRALWK